ncbi:MAG: hypothetical protein LAT68_04800 [Cyclobacteriaceae bacterium]|nr:hypothetical protein [Cyclobacteriaceae bacterium]MCH8515630.1 hypothetical protein [Cyclobacteriaceae bacterium]
MKRLPQQYQAMDRQEFFKNEYATVFQREGDITVLKYFQKVPSHEMFLTVNEAIIDAYRERPTQILIADIRDMGILKVASQKWISNTLLPTLINILSGKTLYHAQLLNPNEIMSKVSANNVKRFEESLKSNFVMIQYDSEKELEKGITEFRKLI